MQEAMPYSLLGRLPTMKKLAITAMMLLACVVTGAPTVWSDSAAALIKKLKHENPAVRVQAAKDLAES